MSWIFLRAENRIFPFEMFVLPPDTARLPLCGFTRPVGCLIWIFQPSEWSVNQQFNMFQYPWSA
jgi:hypothetical protein